MSGTSEPQTPGPQPQPAARTATATQPGGGPTPGALGLTVEEYPIVAMEVDAPERLEYAQRIDPQIREVRRAWREVPLDHRVEMANQSLNGFGYQLHPNERSDHHSPLFNLCQGDAVILNDIDGAWPVAVSDRGDDFAVVLTTKRGHPQLMTRAGFQPWDEMKHGFVRPVFAGNDLVFVEMDYEGRRVAVVQGSRTVHTQLIDMMAVDNPVKGLWSWGDHWVLEVKGVVLVDGQSLNQQMGYDEVFGWRLLGGQPFYYFKKGDDVGISYADQVLPNRYSQVIHYRCCEPAAFNVRGNDTMVWFHALKEGTWHYVEAGVYGDPPRGSTGTPSGPVASGKGAVVSESGKALSSGTIEDAMKALEVTVRLPLYLPAGTTQREPVRFQALGGRGLIVVEYRVGDSPLTVQYLKGPAESFEVPGARKVMLGNTTVVVYTQQKEPSDPFPPTNGVVWRDGEVTVRVIGTVPHEELLKVAQSLQ